MSRQPSSPRWWSGAALGSGLGLALLILSFSRLIGDAQSAAMTGAVFDAAFTGPLWGSILGTNLLGFACALIALHIAFGLVCWLVARISNAAWPSPSAKLSHHVVLWFLVATIALLASNAGNVPQSSLGEPYHGLARTRILGVAVWAWINLLVASGLLVTLVVGLRRWLSRKARMSRPAVVTVATGVVIAAVAAVMPHREPPAQAAAQKPNIILIGIDSLRADALWPRRATEALPNLSAFADKAAVFTNAITPLARTFPSMTTILSGRHPHSTGAYMNLTPRRVIREGDTLGRVLGRAGYATTYATDEVRFSNIDASYGFDREITPPIGTSEVVLSFIGDTPLLNHVVNTWVGEKLFPHLHANRGASRTYDPDRFLHRLDREVDFRPPMFLTVHLTLAHWPYTWIDIAPFNQRKANQAIAQGEHKWPEYYVRAVGRADQQFGDLMQLLERRGALQNALVIVYSDHGESFGYSSEFLTPQSSDPHADADRHKWGHGTSVLVPDQYRVVLAMRAFGSAQRFSVQGRTIDAPVAVQDIAPTITDMLRLQSRNPFEGRSLTGLLRNDPAANASFASRVRFTETEFTPRNIASQSGMVSVSGFEAARKFYDLNRETDRLELQQHRLATLLSERQYAALGKNFLVAALPSKVLVEFQYVVIDLRSGALERLSGPPAATAPAEVNELWRALHAKFGKLLANPTRDARESLHTHVTG